MEKKKRKRIGIHVRRVETERVELNRIGIERVDIGLEYMTGSEKGS